MEKLRETISIKEFKTVEKLPAFVVDLPKNSKDTARDIEKLYSELATRVNWLLGLPHGSVYGNEIDWTQASAALDTWYNISDTDMEDGDLYRITHDGKGKLTVPITGKYLCDYDACLETDAANKHVQISFSINGTPGEDGMNHLETLGISKLQAIGGNAILSLSAGDTVQVAVRTTDTGTPELLVDHLNISITCRR